MFDHTHCVPVLRWKQAEQHALRDLFPWVKSQFTPLIEAPERGPDNPDSLCRYPSSLLKMCGTAPFFFDFGPFSSGVSVGTYEDFFAESRSRGLSIIPVTGLATNDVLQDSIGNRGHGLEICLRLYRDDLDRGDLIVVLDDVAALAFAEDHDAYSARPESLPAFRYAFGVISV